MFWWTAFDIDSKEKEIKELELEMQATDFWKDQKNAAKTSQKVVELKEEIEIIDLIKKELADLKELGGLSSEHEDLGKLFNILKEKVEKEEFRIFLSGKHDKKNALLEIFS